MWLNISVSDLSYRVQSESGGLLSVGVKWWCGDCSSSPRHLIPRLTTATHTHTGLLHPARWWTDSAWRSGAGGGGWVHRGHPALLELLRRAGEVHKRKKTGSRIAAGNDKQRKLFCRFWCRGKNATSSWGDWNTIPNEPRRLSHRITRGTDPRQSHGPYGCVCVH